LSGESLAIFISIFSVLVAALSLGWNIYRDVILKAKIKVSITYGFITSPGIAKPLDRIIISATNFGPGRVHLSGLRLQETSLIKKITRKTKFYLLTYNYTDPLSSKLPCTLDVGETSNFIFNIEDNCFLSFNITHVGVMDTFGRMPWSSKKEVTRAKESFKKDLHEKSLKKTSKTGNGAD
jgi:hypothetical protein